VREAAEAGVPVSAPAVLLHDDEQHLF
jgi:hypothetical protein